MIDGNNKQLVVGRFFKHYGVYYYGVLHFILQHTDINFSKRSE